MGEGVGVGVVVGVTVGVGRAVGTIEVDADAAFVAVSAVFVAALDAACDALLAA